MGAKPPVRKRAESKRGPSTLVFKTLMLTGSIAVGFAAVATTPVYLATGVSYALIVPIVIAGLSLLAMWSRSRATISRCLRRLWPLGAFALITLGVAAIASFRMGAGVAGVVRYSLGPASWFSAAVIGYISGRSNRVPLVVAVGSATAAALLGLVALTEAFGASSPIGRFYIAWLTATGAWSPSSGEYFRAVGLDLDPNAFGLIGAVAVVAALCIRGPVWTRVLGGAACGSVLALSGSRTALAASMAGLVVAALVQWADRRASGGHRAFSVVPALSGLLVAIVVLGFAVTAQAGPDSALRRLGISGSTAAASDVTGQSAVDIASSGRTEIWAEALRWYRRYPFGAFLQPESLVGRSIHNEYLERLLFGGPVLLAAFVGLLVWLAARIRPSSAPALGPTLCAVYAVSALTLGPSLQPAFLTLAFYLVGWGRAQPEDAISLAARHN